MKLLFNLSSSAMIVNFCRMPGVSVCIIYPLTVGWSNFNMALEMQSTLIMLVISGTTIPLFLLHNEYT